MVLFCPQGKYNQNMKVFHRIDLGRNGIVVIDFIS